MEDDSDSSFSDAGSVPHEEVEYLSREWSPYKVFGPFYSGGRVLYDPIKEVLFTAYIDTIIITDPFSLRRAASIEIQGDSIIDFVLTQSLLVVGYASNLVRIFSLDFTHWSVVPTNDANTVTFTLTKTFKVQGGGRPGGSRIRVLATDHVSHNLVAIGTVDGHIFVHDVIGNFPTHAPPKHRDRISYLGFHPKRQLLFSSSEDGQIRVYDLYRYCTIAHLYDHISAVTSIAFIQLSEDSKSIGGVISCGRDSVLNVWSLDRLDKLPPVEEVHNGKKRTPDLKAVKVIELKPVQQMNAEEPLEAVLCISTKILTSCFNKKKPLSEICPWAILSAGHSAALKLWNPVSRQCLGTLETPHAATGAVTALSLFTNARGAGVLMSVGEDQNIAFWNIASLQCRKLLLGNPTELLHCQFLHSHCGSDKESAQSTPSTLPTPNDPDNDVVMEEESTPQPSSVKCILLRSDKFLTFFEMSEGRVSASLATGHSDTVLCSDVSSDGCWIVTGSKDQSLVLWSSRLSAQVAVVEGHASPVVATAFGSKGVGSCSCEKSSENKELVIASACLEGMLRLWKVNTSELREALHKKKSKAKVFVSEVEEVESLCKIRKATASILAHDKEINQIAISPDDLFVATASSDKTVKIWSIPKLKLLGKCLGHKRPVWCLKFSPTEKVLASGSGDGTIKIWNLKDYQCLKTFQGHSASVSGLQFITLGTQIISSSTDGQIKLWNIRTSECVNTFSHHDGKKIWSLSKHPSYRQLLTCGADQRLIVWQDATKESEQQRIENQRAEAQQISDIQHLAQRGQMIEALSLCLRLKRPHQMRQLFHSSFDAQVFTGGSGAAVSAKELIKNASENELRTLLQFCCQWNSSGKTSSLANFLMTLILQNVDPEKVSRLEGFDSISENFYSYLPRHSTRIAGLLQRSFVLDLLLQDASQNVELPTRQK